jgi:hypothetical protein
MRFICLGYIEDTKWESLSADQQKALMEECFVYDDFLRKNGHFAGGEALQPGRTAKTVSEKNGKIVVTDGPFAETKEQIGGILILEAKDMDHAVGLMSKHPGVRLGGPFEIRPADEMVNELVKARQ